MADEGEKKEDTNISCFQRLICNPLDFNEENDDNSKYEDEEKESQAEVLAQLSTLLIIFIFYFQQLGLIVGEDETLYDEWGIYFNWIRFFSLSININLDTIDQQVTLLIATFLFPIFLQLHFQQSLDTSNTDISTDYGKGIRLFYIILVATSIILSITTVLFWIFISAPSAAYLAVFASYTTLSCILYFLKYYYIEISLISHAEERGSTDFIQRIRTNRTILYVIQLLWILSFTPIAAVWIKVGLLNENIYISTIFGIIGGFLLLYMILFQLCVANYSLLPTKRNKKISKLNRYLFLIGFAKDVYVHPGDISNTHAQFRSSSWWFQSIFLVERFLMTVAQNVEKGALNISTFVIATLFVAIIFFVLPYLTAVSNRVDTLSRISNLIVLGLATAKAEVSRENENGEVFQNVATIILFINSIIMFFVWLVLFRPIMLLKATVRKIRYFIALFKWRNVKTLKQANSILQPRQPLQKVKKQEWFALTTRQKFLSLCVKRHVDLKPNKVVTDLGSDNLKVDSKIEYFSFHSTTKISIEDLYIIRRKGFKAMKNVKVLDFESSYLGLDEMKALSETQALSSLLELKYLNFSKCYLRSKGCIQLINSLSTQNTENVNTSLINLNLENCKLGDSCASVLSSYLSHNYSLKKLTLYNNRFGDSSAKLLFEALKKNKKLEVLNLRLNLLTDIGATEASKMLACNTSLLKLNLMYNYISYTGLESILSSIKSTKTLKVFVFGRQSPQDILKEFLNSVKDLETEEREEELITHEDTFPPSTSKLINNAMATILLDHKLLFEDCDSFVNDALLLKKIFVLGALEVDLVNTKISFDDDKYFEDFTGDDDSDSSSSSSSSSDSDSVINDGKTNFSKLAWKHAEDGYCSIIAVAVSCLIESAPEALKEVINIPNNDEITITELVLTKGVSYAHIALEVLYKAGMNIYHQTKNNESLLLIARSHEDEKVRQWASTFSTAFAHQYKILPDLLLSKSARSEIFVGQDVSTEQLVCIKSLSNVNHMLNELFIRDKIKSSGKLLSISIKVLWSTTSNPEIWDKETKSLKSTEAVSVEYPFTLVMPLAREDLAKFLSTTPTSYEIIKGITIGVAKALTELASINICHGNLKPRNILLYVNNGVLEPKLADFSGSVEYGSQFKPIYSTAYMPPERASSIFGNVVKITEASASFDVWSFGVVFYEVLFGTSLFKNTSIPEDNVVIEADKKVLLNWNEAELTKRIEAVAMNFTDLSNLVESSRFLLHYCLSFAPTERISMSDLYSTVLDCFNKNETDTVPITQQQVALS